MTSLTPRDAVPLATPARLVGYAPFTGHYHLSRAIESVQLVRGEPHD